MNLKEFSLSWIELTNKEALILAKFIDKHPIELLDLSDINFDSIDPLILSSALKCEFPAVNPARIHMG